MEIIVTELINAFDDYKVRSMFIWLLAEVHCIFPVTLLHVQEVEYEKRSISFCMQYHVQALPG